VISRRSRVASVARVAPSVRASSATQPPRGAIYEAGAKTESEPALRPRFRAALALLEQPSAETMRAAERETLAVADVLVQRADHELPFLGIVASVRSVSDAVRVLALSLGYVLTAGSGGWTTAVWVTTSSSVDLRWTERWLTVRHAVCGADPAAYAEAVAVAHALRRGRVLAQRVPLAFVFPDEPWGARHPRDPWLPP